MKRSGPMVLLAAAVSLAGCEQKTPGVYNLSIAEAYQRLAANKLPDLVYGRQCGILIHVTPSGVPDGKVTWRVTSSGEDVVAFTAILTSLAENQTKVEIKMPADPDGGEVYDGAKFYRRPAFNQPLRPAVEEQVAAILEGRSFDNERLGPGKDSVCNVQRAGLEVTGTPFHVNDPTGRP